MRKYLLFLFTITATMGWHVEASAPINPKFENYEYDLTEERPTEMTYFFPNHKGIYHDENGNVISREEAERRNNSFKSFYGDYSIDWPENVDGAARDNIIRVLRQRLYREYNKFGDFSLSDDGNTDLDEIILRRFRTAIDVGFPEDRLSIIVINRKGDTAEMIVVPEVGVNASNVTTYPNGEKYVFNIYTGERIEKDTPDAKSNSKAASSVHKYGVNDTSDPAVESLIHKLWEGVPDLGQNNKTRFSFSKRFYDIINIAFAIPGDNPRGVGSEAVVWNWYTYDEDAGPNAQISQINITQKTPEQISATVVYDDDLGHKVPHNIVLIKETRRSGSDTEEIRWVINDFDNMKDKLYEYINNVGIGYVNGLADRIISENSDWMPEEDIEAFRKDVDIFLEKFNATYPNGVVRK